MRYVGLDAHLRQSTFCVLDDRGRKIMTRTVKGTWAAVFTELTRIRPPFASCFEASAGSGFLFKRLQRIARRVVVAHPGLLRLIVRSKRKNDRVDAEKLAKLLVLDEVQAVYVPSGSTHAWRRMIEHRRTLVGERTRAKNALRALLRSQEINAPRGLWSRRGLTWLSAVDLPTGLDTLQCDILQERLLSLTRMNGRVETELGRAGTAHAGVQLLMTIPGVGIRTAEAVMASVDNPDRFHRIKAIGRYFGMVPSQDASAQSNRLATARAKGPRSCGTWSLRRPGRELVDQRTCARSTTGSVERTRSGRRSRSWPPRTICFGRCWRCSAPARSGDTRTITGDVTAGIWPGRLPFQSARAWRRGRSMREQLGPRISCMVKAGRVW